MKIISKYVLREHVGPLTFALTALTSLMLLNFISRRFGDLVGKGLDWTVIGEFFLLSIPFTVALTVPMSVLVAVLYAFSRLAAENEIVAFKASGVSPFRMVYPVIIAGFIWSAGLLAFNDQVLPRANHRLKSLQDDISQAKPTFLLKEQVINPIAEGKFYLKAGRIDRGTSKMKEVVIYDLADPMRRRTIYADSGTIGLADNRTDLDLNLYHGQMQEVSTDKPGQLDRLFYDHDRIRIRDVSRDFKKTESDSSAKGDREMSVCEMQQRLKIAETGYRMAQRDYADAVASKGAAQDNSRPASAFPEPRGIGWAYCALIERVFRVKEAQAADLTTRLADTIPLRDSVAVTDTAARRDAFRAALARRDSLQKAALRLDSMARRRDTATSTLLPPASGTRPLPPAAPVLVVPQPAVVPVATDADTVPTAPPIPVADMAQSPAVSASMNESRLAEAKLRLDMATRGRNRYDIEIHKKFSLAAACLIFVIVGAPLAVRFPRGGVGLVLGVSLFVFALYYVGLIGGESLANEGIMQPFWAMWGTNVLLTLVGIVLLVRMGRDQNTGRGGDLREFLDKLRARVRPASVPPAAPAAPAGLEERS